MVKKQKSGLEKRQIILIFICLSLLIGTIAGSIAANTMDELQLKQLGEYLSGFFHDFSGESVAQKENFIDSFWKYEKYTALIWICGFLPPGAVVIIVVLLFRGIGLGFTTAVMIQRYGSSGILLAIVSYLPQNIFLIPVLILMSCTSIEYILKKFTYGTAKTKLKREKQKTFLEYCIIFALCTLLVGAACAIEVYLVPGFMEKTIQFIG